MLSISMGALVGGSLRPAYLVLLAALSGGFITAAANTINDFFDLEIDSVNKPHRPLPAGLVSPVRARNWAFLLFAIGIALSIFIRPLAFGIAVFSSLLLFLYSYRLKRTVLWGNLTVSLISGIAFVYGGIAVNHVEMAFIPAVFAFFFHFGREVLKDLEDVPGDKKDNVKTFPISHGLNPTRWLISAIFLLLIFLTFIPYIAGIFGRIYLLIVLVGVDLFLIYVIASLWRDASIRNLHRLSEALKVDMLVGLLAIFAGITFG